MKNLLRIVLVVALATLVTGCCGCRKAQKKARLPLVGTEWQLIQLGERTIVPQEGKFTLTFLSEENRVAGVGACNRLTGTYQTGESNALKIGPLISTRMACEGMDVEQQFAKALETTTRYDMDGQMLMLFENGTLQAVFQAKP